MAERVSRHGQGLGWDGPVEIILPGTINWENDAKTFAALVQDTAPMGETGELKRDLSLRRATVKRFAKPRRGFSYTVNNSYAQVIDEGSAILPGGVIPERRPRGYLAVTDDAQGVDGERAGHAMRWVSKSGEVVFAKYAGPFEIEAQHYIERGFDRWMKARGHEGVGAGVGWANRPGDGA